MGVLTTEGVAEFLAKCRRTPDDNPSHPETHVSEPHVDMPDAVMVSSEASASSARPHASDVSDLHALDAQLVDHEARGESHDHQDTYDTNHQETPATHVSGPHVATPDDKTKSSEAFSTAPAASDASAPETLDYGIVGPPDDMANASSALADCSNRGDSLTHNDAHVCEVVSSEASSMPPDASAAPASQVLDRWLVGRHAKLEVLRDTLFAWPEDMLRSVASLPCVSAAEHAEYAEYLVTVLSSMSLSTSFSGVDSPSNCACHDGCSSSQNAGPRGHQDSVPKACNKFASNGSRSLSKSSVDIRLAPAASSVTLMPFGFPPLQTNWTPLAVSAGS